MIVYEVVSRYIDCKKNTFCLNTIETESLPQNTFEQLKTRDVYHDYFSDKEIAEKFIEDSKKGLIQVNLGTTLKVVPNGMTGI